MYTASNFHKQSKKSAQKGNAAIIALVAALLVGGAAFAYFMIRGDGTESAANAATATAPAAGAEASSGEEAKTAAGDKEIKPGNPVVAKIDGKDISRMDVLNFIQTLPPQTRQMPLEQLFPLAVNQVVNTQVVIEKTKDAKLDDDPEVKKQMERAKDEITRTVYLQKLVEKRMTDDRLKKAYDSYVKNFPDVQELKASHILVKEESKAKDLIAQLDKGADFAQLAKDNSIDGTAKNGGQLGYFVENEVVPEFSKAAFALPVGSYTKTPVKTQFGYHVIKSEDKRKREAAPFEQVKQFLETQVRREVLDEILKEWRAQAKIETFDINGDKIEPAAGK